MPAPTPVYLSGGPLRARGYMHNSDPTITVDDLRAAIEAHGGNQTTFAREVLGCTDGRQVRRWLAGARMGWEHARKLAAHLKETQGTMNLFASRRGKGAPK